MVKDKTSFYLDPLHSVGYLTRINFRAFSKALENLTEPHGVTAGQWRILRVLWEEDGITQREISNRVGITEATAVKSLAGLETKELITREVDKSDSLSWMSTNARSKVLAEKMSTQHAACSLRLT